MMTSYMMVFPFKTILNTSDRSHFLLFFCQAGDEGLKNIPKMCHFLMEYLCIVAMATWDTGVFNVLINKSKVKVANL